MVRVDLGQSRLHPRGDPCPAREVWLPDRRRDLALPLLHRDGRDPANGCGGLRLILPSAYPRNSAARKQREGMRRNRGRIALVLTIVIWGSALVVTKSLLQEMGPFTVGVLRFLIAWVLLAPFAFRQGYRLRLSVRPTFQLFGLTGIALYIAMTNLGLVFTSASSAALVQASIPAVTTLLSVLVLKERVSRLQLF